MAERTLDQELLILANQIKGQGGRSGGHAAADIGRISLALDRMVKRPQETRRKQQYAIAGPAIRSNISKLDKKEDIARAEETYQKRLKETRGHTAAVKEEARTYLEDKERKRTLESRKHTKDVLGESRTYIEEGKEEADVMKAYEGQISDAGAGSTSIEDFDQDIEYLETFKIDHQDNMALQLLSDTKITELATKREALNRRDLALADLEQGYQDLESLVRKETKGGQLVFTDIHTDELRDRIKAMGTSKREAEQANYIAAENEYDSLFKELSKYITLRGSLKQLDADASTGKFDYDKDLSAIILPESQWLTIGDNGEKIQSSAKDALVESIRQASVGDYDAALKYYHISDSARRESIDREQREISAAAKKQGNTLKTDMDKIIGEYNVNLKDLVEGAHSTGANVQRLTSPGEGLAGEKGFFYKFPSMPEIKTTGYATLEKQTDAAILSTLAASTQHADIPLWDDMDAGTRDVDKVIRAWFTDGMNPETAGAIIEAIVSRKGKKKDKPEEEDFNYEGVNYNFSKATFGPEGWKSYDLKGDDAYEEGVQKSHLNSLWMVRDQLRRRGRIMKSLATLQGSDAFDISKVAFEDFLREFEEESKEE